MTLTIPNPVDVLYVEDTQSDADLTIRALSKRDLSKNLYHVNDGAEALDFIFCKGRFAGRDKINPRLILLDLKMPKVSGLEVLKQIKSDPATQAIPIVVMTSSAEAPDVKNAFELGANSYILKPIGFENFSEVVKQLGLYWLKCNLTSR